MHTWKSCSYLFVLNLSYACVPQCWRWLLMSCTCHNVFLLHTHQLYFCYKSDLRQRKWWLCHSEAVNEAQCAGLGTSFLWTISQRLHDRCESWMQQLSFNVFIFIFITNSSFKLMQLSTSYFMCLAIGLATFCTIL